MKLYFQLTFSLTLSLLTLPNIFQHRRDDHLHYLYDDDDDDHDHDRDDDNSI